MAQIDIAQGFMLDVDGELQQFAPGTQEVPDAVAEHWFTRSHLVGAEKPPDQRLTYQQRLALAEQATHAAEAVRPVHTPAPTPVDVRDELLQVGGIRTDARYFAGKPQVDALLPGQERQVAPYAVSYGKIPR